MATPPTTYLETVFRSKEQWQRLLEKIERSPILQPENLLVKSMEQLNDMIKVSKVSPSPPTTAPINSAWYKPDENTFYMFDGEYWNETDEHTAMEAQQNLLNKQRAYLSYDRAMKGI